MRKIWLGFLKRLKFLPPPLYVKIYYEYYTGKRLDLENPKTFNEKIQWLKAYYKPPILTQLVDKYSVRSFVEERVGRQYLNSLIGVYDNPAEVDFDKLPDKFVLKATHAFHFNLLVRDKQKLNRSKAKLLMYKWMSKNQYWRGGLEWAYKNVKPRIIAETFLEELGKDDVVDYKFFCYNGEPRFLHIDLDRGTHHKRAYYDLDWNKLDVYHDIIDYLEDDFPRPDTLGEMIEVSRKLADGFPFVRVDLYSLNGRIIFGELTFYPADGRLEFQPEHYNLEFGELMELPEIPEGKSYIDCV